MVWDDLKRFRLSQTARQVVSEDTSRVVWDDLKRFRLSQTAHCSSGLGRPETFPVVPTHFAPTSARVNVPSRTCSNAEGFGGLGFRGSHCHPDTRLLVAEWFGTT